MKVWQHYFVGKTHSCIVNIPSIATIRMAGNLAASNNNILIYIMTQQFQTFRNLSKDKLEKEV